MKKTLLSPAIVAVCKSAAFGCLVTLSTSALAVDPVGATTNLPGKSWNFKWGDEFNGTQLDWHKWKVGGAGPFIAGVGGNESSCISVGNGMVSIRPANRQSNFTGTTRSYSTGEISSYGPGRYHQARGYYEARVRYTEMKGLWPAFWTMPDRGQYVDFDPNNRATESGNRQKNNCSYLKFNLTGASLPAAAGITSVKLVLYIKALSHRGGGEVIDVFSAADNWSASTMTWLTQADYDPLWLAHRFDPFVAGSNELIPAPLNAPVEFDVTAYVRQEVAGDKIVSFRLADDYSMGFVTSFYSGDAANATYRPKLVITAGATTYPAYPVTEDVNLNEGGANIALDTLNVSYCYKSQWGDIAHTIPQGMSTFGDGAEMDIQEALGVWGTKVLCSMHWDGYGSAHKSTGTPTPYNYGGATYQWHTYGLYWEDTRMIYYTDGVPVYTWTNSMDTSGTGEVPGAPMQILLSLQLGTWPSGGNDISDPVAFFAANPALDVDYVRIWEETASSGGTGGSAAVFQAETVTSSYSSGVSKQFFTDTAANPTGATNNAVVLYFGATGQFIDYTLPNIEAGNYKVDVRYRRGSNRGQMKLKVDGVYTANSLPGGSADQYDPSVNWVNSEMASNVALAGTEHFIFEVSGKNAASTGYALTFDQIVLTPLNTNRSIVVMDNLDGIGSGAWTRSTSTGYYYNLDTQFFDAGVSAPLGNAGTTFSFKPVLSGSGNYDVYLRWPYSTPYFGKNVPVDIISNTTVGTPVATLVIDQTSGGGSWVRLGNVAWNLTTTPEVRIRTLGINGVNTLGQVMADAVKFVPR